MLTSDSQKSKMGATLTKPVCIAAGITYPAYASFKALESPNPDDDKQWLTYWVVYGLCTSMETVSARLISWLPGYYLTKMLVLIWMMLPKTKVRACWCRVSASVYM